MRRIARGLLFCLAFAIPWEYSLELGDPFGNVGRVAGFAVLIVTVLAVVERGAVRRPGAMQWLVLCLFLWFCCSCFWSVDVTASQRTLRGYFQEMMLVWLVWELAETPEDLRTLLRAYVAGSWVLAALTLANWASPEAVLNGQTRFVAEGQDPNDVARFLDLAFPMAALLVGIERRWTGRALAAGYLPLGLLAVLLTGSRGGFLTALVALLGCALLLLRGDARRLVAGVALLLISALCAALATPSATYRRLATIIEQLRGGDLNQRLNIWSAGWDAFAQAPWFGRGAGSFVSAARLAPIDTAHNTILSIGTSGGLCALFVAAGIVGAAVAAILRLRGGLQVAMATVLLAWATISLVATVEESRTTWLALATIAFAGRIAGEDPAGLQTCFGLQSSAVPCSPARQAGG